MTLARQVQAEAEAEAKAEPEPPAADRRYPPQSAVACGFLGRCPRCGQGRLFAGYLALARRCEACDLDFGFADAGDGPAVFVTLIAGFLALGLALAIDVAYEPPIWVYAFFFLPLTTLLCLALLRPLKGWLVASQYKSGAAPGRLDAP